MNVGTLVEPLTLSLPAGRQACRRVGPPIIGIMTRAAFELIEHNLNHIRALRQGNDRWAFESS